MLGSCRLCTDPGSLFKTPAKKKGKKGKNNVINVSSNAEDDHEPRTQAEIKKISDQWWELVHERAATMFPSEEAQRAVLENIAVNIHKNDDPISGKSDSCVQWYGEYTDDADGREAAITLRSGEAQENVTFVNRVIVFVFASDESFQKLQKLPRKPFRMRCANQMCINLKHINMSS